MAGMEAKLTMIAMQAFQAHNNETIASHKPGKESQPDSLSAALMLLVPTLTMGGGWLGSCLVF